MLRLRLTTRQRRGDTACASVFGLCRLVTSFWGCGVEKPSRGLRDGLLCLERMQKILGHSCEVRERLGRGNRGLCFASPKHEAGSFARCCYRHCQACMQGGFSACVHLCRRLAMPYSQFYSECAWTGFGNIEHLSARLSLPRCLISFEGLSRMYL